MNRRIVTLLAGGAAAGTLAMVGPLSALPPRADGYNKSTEHASTDCGNGRKLVIWSPDNLWPPNHKYYGGSETGADAASIRAIATGANPQERVELNTEGWHDQYDADTGAEMNGSGNTADDITIAEHEDATKVTQGEQSGMPSVVYAETGNGSVVSDWRARAERSGRDQKGRSYTLKAQAIFGGQGGATCTASVEMAVPHDMGVGTPQNGKKR